MPPEGGLRGEPVQGDSGGGSGGGNPPQVVSLSSMTLTLVNPWDRTNSGHATGGFFQPQPPPSRGDYEGNVLFDATLVLRLV